VLTHLRVQKLLLPDLLLEVNLSVVLQEHPLEVNWKILPLKEQDEEEEVLRKKETNRTSTRIIYDPRFHNRKNLNNLKNLKNNPNNRINLLKHNPNNPNNSLNNSNPNNRINLNQNLLNNRYLNNLYLKTHQKPLLQKNHRKTVMRI